MEPSKRKGAVALIVAGMVCAAAVACAFVLSGSARGFAKDAFGKDTVSVKGYAEQLVDSDFCEWDVGASVAAGTRAGAVAAAEAQRAVISAALVKAGVAAAQMAFDPIEVSAVHEKDARGDETDVVAYYAASLSLRVSSPDTALVERLSREVVRLNGPELALRSESPRYLVRDLEQYKLELIKQAAATARARAQEIVAAAGMRLGALKSANQGVFQVTTENSVDVSGYGEYDTSTRRKKVSLVATLEFGVEN